MTVSKDVSDAPGSDVSDIDQSKVNQINPEANVSAEKTTVDYGSYNKAVGQYKKAKEINQQLQDKLSNYEKAEMQREEKRLTDQGEYQKLIELKDGKIGELVKMLETVEGEKQHVSNTLVNAKKMSAVYDKLPGRLKNDKYMEFVDIESVAINPDTGDIDLESVAVVANKFMDEHAALVDISHIGRLKGTASQTTMPLHKSYRELPLKDMRKNMADAVRAAKNDKGL